MIPKTIHYCWFGGKPLPKSAKKCIASWHKYFPDYEIKEWNEVNYDVHKNPYISRTYEAKKYAFVSDYARFDILYHEGGVYFDTDVEVIRSFDDILAQGAFMGCERDGSVSSETEMVCFDGNLAGKAPGLCIAAAPGLGIAAVPGLGIYQEILKKYETLFEAKDEDILPSGYVVPFTTQVLLEHGLQDINGIQQVGEITIYPAEYFNPLDSITGKLYKTANTHSIHWFTASWLSPTRRIRHKITTVLRRLFGKDCFVWLKHKNK